MSRGAFVRILVALVLLLEVPSYAIGGAIDDTLPQEAPQVPAEDVPETGIIPADRTTNDTLGTVNDQLESGYQVVADTLNPALDRVEAAAAVGVVVYRDGMGGEESADPADERAGGFGDWRFFGSNWGIDPNAAFRGNKGLTTSTAPGGLYTGGARALVVSPEIDLRSATLKKSGDAAAESDPIGQAHRTCDDVAENFPPPLRNDPNRCMPVGSEDAPEGGRDVCEEAGVGTACSAPVSPPRSVSSVYNGIYQACWSVSGTSVGAPPVPDPDFEPFLAPVCLAYQDILDSQAWYASFSYERRFNLGDGLDGVQVIVFNSPPQSVDDVAQCDFAPREHFPEDPPHCRIAIPQSGYQGSMTVLDGKSGYTGFNDWSRDVIDLTPWEGHSVWVGFYFASSTIVSPTYFQNPSRFVVDAGFFGFDVDDIEVASPAAPVNVRVRDLTQPSFTPAGLDRPTLAPGSTVPVAANVTNFAARPTNITITTRILYESNRTEAERWESPGIVVPPGAYVSMRRDFDALDNGSYVAQVCVERASQEIGSDAAFCDEPPRLGACSSDGLTADPCSQVSETPFDIRPVLALTPGIIEQSIRQLQLGETMTFALRIRNDGNLPQTVKARAHLVDARTNTLSGDDLIVPEDRQDKFVHIAPGRTAFIQWEVQGLRQGQFRPLVTIGDPPPFNPAFDTVPALLRPWDLDGLPASVPLTIDGGIFDWTTGAVRPLGFDGASIRLANDDQFLFLAITNLSAPVLSLFLDDGGDGVLDPAADVGFLVHANPTILEPGLRTLRPDPESGFWGSVGESQTAMAAASAYIGPEGIPVPGKFTYELRLPMNGTSSEAIRAGPGDVIGLLIAFCDARSAPLRCNRVPELAPLNDGEGLRPPDGGLSDEIKEWRPLRLRQGPFVSNAEVPSSSVIGQGFGVAEAARPYLSADFTQCTDLLGWKQLDSGLPSGLVQDKWTCGPYVDEGRPLMYKGVTRATAEALEPVLPYAGIPTLGQPRRDRDFLWTSPFDIPADSINPTLVLAHQYSTDIRVEDGALAEDLLPTGRIKLNHQLGVSLEEWTEDGWRNLGKLEPLGGYSSEESVGILSGDPRRYYADQDCPPLGDTADGCQFTSTAGFWWWPQGDQRTARSNDTGLPTGRYFEGGSPWRTDLVPLTASHSESTPLQVAGKTLRLRFSLMTAEYTRAHNETLDWGWRIGGISVIEEARLSRDVAVVSAAMGTPYDAAAIGLGPGTMIPVHVSVLNAGVQDVAGVEVTLVGQDVSPGAPRGSELCRSASTVIPGTLLAGQARNVTVSCEIADVPGAVVAFRVVAHLAGIVDDFLGNNQQRIRGHFDIQPHLAATVDVAATPREATTEAVRSIVIRVNNRGNAPLEDLAVEYRIARVTAAGLEETGIGRHWSLADPLPVDAAGVTLSAATSSEPPLVPNRDLSVQLPRAGTYVVIARLAAPGLQGGEILSQATLVASNVLYSQDFDRPANVDTDVVKGSIDFGTPWSRGGSGDVLGPGAATASDSATGEIPAGTEGFLTLPDLDLTSAKRAVLSFSHRYDLEVGFDAGRLEISTDGGETWSPLTPRAQPLNGLPLGYPSTALLGSTDLLNGSVESFASAYTGNSADLPGNDHGWISAEFDLTRQPQFWVTTALDPLRLENPASHADPFPMGPVASPEFRSPTWTLPEPDAEENLRYWWIDNLTYSKPKPVTGGTMWWSGSAGPAQGASIGAVNTKMSAEFGTAGLALGPSERLVLSFWDWRAGGSGAEDKERLGTGGDFRITVLPEGRFPVDYRIVETLPSGWTRRELDVTPLAGVSVGIEFHYRSEQSYPLSSNLAPYSLALVQDNRGWFVDDLELIKRGPDGEERLGHIDSSAPGDWEISSKTATGWTRAFVGAAAQDGGWHVEHHTTVPGLGPTPAWRFSSNDEEGYPASADSRLVTPLVDLRTYIGDSAALHFDHRYDLYGDPQLGGQAVDAGQVEYQLFDEATGTFGPWRMLSAIADPRPLAMVVPELLPEDVAAWERFAATGYPSILRAPGGPATSGNEIRLGNGTLVHPGDDDFGKYVDTLNRVERNFRSDPRSSRFDWVDDGARSLYIDIDANGRVSDIRHGDGGQLIADFNFTSGNYVSGLGPSFVGVRLPPEAVQWVDVDGNGRWGEGDVAILSKVALDGGAAGNVVGAGDFRLTAPNGTVESGDGLIGQRLEPPGTFVAFCTQFTADVHTPSRAVYLTPHSESCSGPNIRRGYHFAAGAPFETLPAYARDRFLFVIPGEEPDFFARNEMRVAYVFSGDSAVTYPVTDGWSSVDWDVSQFIGSQVRFAFHASTNPSRGPCPASSFFPRTDFDEPACDGDPLDGWTVANVEVSGQQFRGGPTKIRFHVSTDDSMPKGDWQVDDIVIAGERYASATVVQVENATGQASPGSTIDLVGEIRNLGSSPRSGMAFAVSARRADNGAAIPFEVVGPAGVPELDLGQVPNGFPFAAGQFPLAPGGAEGSSLPLRIRVTLPSSELVDVDVQVQLLEVDRTDPCFTSPAPGCKLEYIAAVNEAGGGSTVGTWRVAVQSRTDVRLVADGDVASPRLFVDRTVAPVESPFHFSAHVQNNGTVTPGTIEAVWRVDQMDRKGDQTRQPGTKQVVARSFELPTTTVGTLVPGAMAAVNASFTPPEAGLYIAHLDVRVDGASASTAQVEFQAGPLVPYYSADFGVDQAGWLDSSTGPDPVRFRLADGRLAWGVTRADFLDGTDYCSFGGCNPEAAGEDSPVFGLEGAVTSPFVDLGRVVGDQAFLTLRVGHVMWPRDGAALEALPLRSPLGTTPQAAYRCVAPSGDSVAAWFRLVPDHVGDLKGETMGYESVSVSTGADPGLSGGPPTATVVARVNPLGDGPAIGGPGVDDEVLSFPLSASEPFVPVCPPGTGLTLPAPQSLLNYTMRLRLRTGTTPGIVDDDCGRFIQCPDNPRHGAMGFQMGEIGITSIKPEVFPRVREVPIVDGFPKTFNLRVVNAGSVDETFLLGISSGATASADAAWFSFPRPSVFVPAGQSMIVPFSVFIPAEPRVPRATYVGFVEARSSLDSNIAALAEVHVNLPQHLLPDLSVRLTAETDDVVPQPGAEVRVFATIDNFGTATSQDVPLEVDVVDETTGTVTHLATTTVESLCPFSTCDAGSSTTQVFGWIPESPGPYRIAARVDPLGRLIEERVDNNIAVRAVNVSALQRPDLAVTSLLIDGVGSDGYVDAGGLVTITAQVTNLGVVPAADISVQIVQDTSELVEAVIPSLAPNETQTVTAVAVASAGERVIRAIVVPTATELSSENNELRRLLRVRATDILLVPEQGAPSILPGGSVASVLRIDNRGNALEQVTLSVDPSSKGWTLTTSPNPVTVAANSTQFAVLTLAAPADAVAGPADLRIRGATASRPDVAILADVPVNVSAVEGAAAVTVTRMHVAPGPANLALNIKPGGNTVGTYFAVLDEPFEWALQAREVSVTGPANLTVHVPVHVPATTAPGPTVVRVSLYDDAGIQRAQGSGPVDVDPKAAASAALKGVVVDDPSDALHRIFHATITVSNDGNVPIEAVVEASELSDGVDLLDLPAPGPIAAGGKAEVDVPIRVDTAFTERATGTLIVLMRTAATDDGKPGETSEIARIGLPVLVDLPDLMIDQVTMRPSAGVRAGDPVELTVTVQNVGIKAASATALRAFVDGAGVNVYDVHALEPGEAQEVSLVWTFEEPGDHLVTFEVVSTGANQEVYLDNNGWTEETIVVASDGLASPSGGAVATLLIALAATMALRRRRDPQDGRQG